MPARTCPGPEPAAPDSLRQRGSESHRDPGQTLSPTRSPAPHSAARRNRECATSDPRARARSLRLRQAPQGARCGAPRRASHSCTVSFPIPLEARIGREQLFGTDVWIVEVHADAQVASFSRDGTDNAAAELAMSHALAAHVARRVL